MSDSNFLAGIRAEGASVMRQLRDLGWQQLSADTSISATGTGGPAMRSINTPVEPLVSTRQHVSILSRLPAKPRPCGIPRPMVAVKPAPSALPRPVVPAKRVTVSVEGKKVLEKTTRGRAAAKLRETAARTPGKPKAVVSAARPALVLKSAMKSSAEKRAEKTVKKVGFGGFNQVATINDFAVWSRPEPRVPM
ncbi:MAG: hypothetical protein LQ346_005663 [Caloplaca aetnensis]|nr:MAG: hypothetical protein LQ346_005663 [Caloplaca aetnensis]